MSGPTIAQDAPFEFVRSLDPIWILIIQKVSCVISERREERRGEERRGEERREEKRREEKRREEKRREEKRREEKRGRPGKSFCVDLSKQKLTRDEKTVTEDLMTIKKSLILY